MSRAVLLVAHGSHFSPDSSRPVHMHRDTLRGRPGFDEVRTAFWREEPALSRGLDGFDADDVTVVPVLISAGYFANEVVPREMGLTARVSRVGGKTVRYTEPVGAHPALASVIARRAEEAGMTGTDAMVVLGHGTGRNPDSERNVYRQAERLAELLPDREVHTAFIEQEPAVEQVLGALGRLAVTIVPLFIADGWHVGTTIREDLGLDDAARPPARPVIRLASAVGTHPMVADIIADIVDEAAEW